MKTLASEHYYCQSVEQIFQFFSNPDSIAEKYHQLNARNFRLKSMNDSGTELTIDARREVPVSDSVPRALRKFAGEWNRVRQREKWTLNDDGSRYCEIRVDIDGIPAKVNGTLKLVPTADGCINKINIGVSCSLPLIGNSLAEFVGSNIDQQMESEYQFIKTAAAAIDDK